MKMVSIPAPCVQHSESEFSQTDWKVEYTPLVAASAKTRGRNDTDTTGSPASVQQLHPSDGHTRSYSSTKRSIFETGLETATRI